MTTFCIKNEKQKGQWRTLQCGLRTKDPGDWKATIIACCTLHNISIDIGKQGWKWDSGVVPGTTKRNPGALPSDPTHTGLPTPGERLPDDDSVKPRRDAALALLKTRVTFG